MSITTQQNVLKGFTLNELAKLVAALGEENVKKIITSVEADAKYGTFKFGEIEAIFNKCGGEKSVLRLLQITDAHEVTIFNREIISVIYSFFDEIGKRFNIGLKEMTSRPEGRLYIEQPEITDAFFTQRAARFCESKNAPSELIDYFQERYFAVKSQIVNNKQCRNILKGTHFPLLINRRNIQSLGIETEKMVYSLKTSYAREFPEREFNDVIPITESTNPITLAAGSRYEQLLEAVRLTKKDKPVFAIYFPLTLAGFSTSASIEQLKELPNQYILSGPIDFEAAAKMYPDFLLASKNIPTYVLSSVRWGQGYSLAIGDDKDAKAPTIYFGDWGYIDRAYKTGSTGLLYLDDQC